MLVHIEYVLFLLTTLLLTDTCVAILNLKFNNLRFGVTRRNWINRDKKTTTITCQGQKDWLQCPMYRLIKINSAFWGRDDTKTCVRSGVEHGLKTNQICAQDESNTMIKVQNACDGESACELVASPVYFDRTDCPDIYKFMRVNWECAHSESRIKDTIQEEKEEIARHMGDDKAKNL